MKDCRLVPPHGKRNLRDGQFELFFEPTYDLHFACTQRLEKFLHGLHHGCREYVQKASGVETTKQDFRQRWLRKPDARCLDGYLLFGVTDASLSRLTE